MSKLKAPVGGCVIRMYRHGLGDCFLLAFGASKDEQKYVLIDCGVLLGTEGAEDMMRDVANDIISATSGHLNAVAITHEHWDHISGFKQARKEFEKITVDKLWFAWTEDPANPLARELRARQMAATAALQAAFKKMDGSKSLYALRINELGAFLGPEFAVKGSASTAEVMDWVKKQWKEHEYCTPGGVPLTIPGLPDVRFYVLGPPNDIKFINKSAPSSKPGEVYLRETINEEFAFFLNKPGADRVRPPFNPAYRCEKNDDDAVKDMDKIYRSEAWRTVDNNWYEGAGELALQLDSHTNNTSLVLAVELVKSGKILLFPGDAQVGNWLSWDNVKWTRKYAYITAGDILARTVMYKVGHHGSHNATLRNNGLERMVNRDLTAFIPVDKEMAKKKNWRMPHKPLLKRLIERANGRVVQADDGLPASSDALVKAFRKVCTEEKLYIDVEFEG